jgi:hypothetical protein
VVRSKLKSAKGGGHYVLLHDGKYAEGKADFPATAIPARSNCHEAERQTAWGGRST